MKPQISNYFTEKCCALNQTLDKQMKRSETASTHNLRSLVNSIQMRTQTMAFYLQLFAKWKFINCFFNRNFRLHLTGSWLLRWPEFSSSFPIVREWFHRAQVEWWTLWKLLIYALPIRFNATACSSLGDYLLEWLPLEENNPNEPGRKMWFGRFPRKDLIDFYEY